MKIYIVQTYYSGKEAYELFGDKSVGAGWYDAGEYTYLSWAKQYADQLKIDGFKARVVVGEYEYLLNPVGKLSRAQKDALIDILIGKFTGFHSNPELFYELLEAKYIQPDKWGDTYELTDLGKEIAESERQLKEQKKVKIRAASRARYGAMSGLGLKKTRYGGWE